MIGILGGTFDPVHFGHLRLAVEMYQDLGLQEVRLVPCRIPPHRNAPQASPEQRLAMLRLAIEHELGLRVDQRELQRDGPSYMVDTLQSLRDELGPDTPLSLILGMDAFDDIDTWHRWEELIQLAHFIVIQRPGVVPHAGKAAGVLLSRYQVERAQMPGGRAGGRILLWTATQLIFLQPESGHWWRRRKVSVTCYPTACGNTCYMRGYTTEVVRANAVRRTDTTGNHRTR